MEQQTSINNREETEIDRCVPLAEKDRIRMRQVVPLISWWLNAKRAGTESKAELWTGPAEPVPL